ncbi:MAG: IS630 family transposase [Chloroflexi bacterium]|nr:IS630 family transposase [Chloroflexota bacterium]
MKSVKGRAAPGFFPPEFVVQIKALACELPSTREVPLSRWSIADLTRHALECGLVAKIGDSTVWRWLHDDAIRPWRYRSWIFPRDPDFPQKAGRILDLYERVWEGQPLKDDELVVSADEKTSLQARRRRHSTYPAQPGAAMKVEHEYTRCGAWAYLAAWDVHRAKLFGRCERKSGIASFDRLVAQVMNQPPYTEARRVFWIVDNGSAHRGPRAVDRLHKRYPNLVLVHGPVHASWSNQIEIYFSIVQRKALTPNDFRSLQALEERLLNFQSHYEQIAKPFEWRFTRRDLHALLNKIQSQRASPTLAA